MVQKLGTLRSGLLYNYKTTPVDLLVRTLYLYLLSVYNPTLYYRAQAISPSSSTSLGSPERVGDGGLRLLQRRRAPRAAH